MHVPTLWDGFDGNAREVSEVRAVCYGVASGSAVLRVSRAVRAVTAVMPLILLRHILENKLEYRRTRPTHTPHLERLCPGIGPGARKDSAAGSPVETGHRPWFCP